MPQLRGILLPYLETRDDDSPLLFPGPDGSTLTKIRSALDEVQKRAEIEKHVTPLVFRHAYTATRIPTLDGDTPVSPFTVARELGHRGIERIEDTYGHLQRRRSRLPEVRYEEDDVVDLEGYRRQRGEPSNSQDRHTTGTESVIIGQSGEGGGPR